MKAETDIWQVETHEGLFQADLPTLKQWVAEGLVLPTDRVRKGALKWIEAGRAPMLRRVFSGEERVEASAPAPQSANAPADVRQAEAAFTPETSPDLGLAGDDAPFRVAEATPSSSCHFHPTQAASLYCRVCRASFCRACPSRVGTSSVLLCALCGGFCDPLEALNERLDLYRRQSEGFGVEDFVTALTYPFKHLASLLGGALLYGLLLLAGMRAQLLASALVFGCISLVIRRVAYGNLKRDFLPDFSEFSFWDDVIVPCSLGVGVTLVTLGPTLLLVFMLVFGWLSGPGPQPSAADHTALAAAEGRESEGVQTVTPEDVDVILEGGTAEQEAEAERKLRSLGPDVRQMEGAQAGEEHAAVYACRLLLAHPGLVLLLGLLALGWAVFYHPMALLVAGWTESLKSVLNPLVGLDTIRHMGATYLKAFLMYLAVQLMSLVLSVVVGLLTAPFDLPFFGNLPATLLGGVVTFYTSLVIACLLGLALFKSADRLGIEID
jgi:hypothetical protein